MMNAISRERWSNGRGVTWEAYLNNPEIIFETCLKHAYLVRHRIPYQDAIMVSQMMDGPWRRFSLTSLTKPGLDARSFTRRVKRRRPFPGSPVSIHLRISNTGF